MLKCGLVTSVSPGRGVYEETIWVQRGLTECYSTLTASCECELRWNQMFELVCEHQGAVGFFIFAYG